MTVQVVKDPQEPGQGSMHLSFWHAKFAGQSAFMLHSGLQFGGLPRKFGRQEQAG